MPALSALRAASSRVAPARAAASARASSRPASPLAAPSMRIVTLSSSSATSSSSSSSSPSKAMRLSPSKAASAEASTSLYDRLGGDAIKLVTSMLFDKLLVDPELGHFFEADTLPKHKAIVARFLIGAMGGPNEYKGRNMVDAHLGLVDLKYPEHFNIVANTLAAVLAELNVPKQETDDVMALVGRLEPDFKKIAKYRAMIEADNE